MLIGMKWEFRYFDKFVNQLGFKARNLLESNANKTNDITTNTGINVSQKPESSIASLYRTRETKYKSLKTFSENMEKKCSTLKMSNKQEVILVKMKTKL